MLKKNSKELLKDPFRIEIPASHIRFFQSRDIVGQIKKLKENINKKNDMNIKTIRILDNISLKDNCFSFKLMGIEKERVEIDADSNFQNHFFSTIEDFALANRGFFR